MWAINAEEEMSLKPAKEIHVKTLFIGATRDAALPPTPAKLSHTHKYVKQLQVEYLAAGHFVQLECPKEVNMIIEKWLNKQLGLAQL